MKVHRCAILAVDPGETSGVALYSAGDLLMTGEMSASDLATIVAVVATALSHAKAKGIPCVLVRERPFGGRMGSNSSGASRVWLAAWHQAGGVKRHSVTVYPATWRSKVLGRGWGSKRREVVRPEEQRVALGIKRASKFRDASVGADEAPAILIGRWAAMAPEVARVLPRAARGM